MKEYCEFPPQKYFTRVLKNCPRSALLYMQLWKKKDNKHMRIICRKVHIRRDFLISPTMFRNLLAPLMYLNILEFIEVDNNFQIDMAGVQQDE
jgi:hypothetical protein